MSNNSRGVNAARFTKHEKVNHSPLVLITWQDSRQPISRWLHLIDLPALSAVKCVTVGWLLKDGPEEKIIAQSMADIESDDDMQTGGVMVIPSRCVLSIDRLVEDVSIPTSSGASPYGRVAVSARKRSISQP